MQRRRLGLADSKSRSSKLNSRIQNYQDVLVCPRNTGEGIRCLLLCRKQRKRLSAWLPEMQVNQCQNGYELRFSNVWGEAHRSGILGVETGTKRPEKKTKMRKKTGEK